MKPRVFAIGETLLDIIFEDGKVIGSVPGGSVLNLAVSLGRTGTDVELISEFGSDPVGEIIRKFLLENNVGTKWSHLHQNHRSTLALAFLDENRNAAYSFYHDSIKEIKEIAVPDFKSTDILAFGSTYSIKPERRNYLTTILNAAKKAGTRILYDPNIRSGQKTLNPELREYIKQNLLISTLVKGSDEDFLSIFGADFNSTLEELNSHCKNFIVTSGKKDVIFCCNGEYQTLQVPEIKPVSTIGAGDNFSAGLIYGWFVNHNSSETDTRLSSESLLLMGKYGLAFSREVCLTMENSVPKGFIPIISK